MDCYNFLVIGSGPAGVSAAMQLQHRGVGLVDIGLERVCQFPYHSLEAALNAHDVRSILGSRWEMLANLVRPRSVHPKLRAKEFSFVASGMPYSVFGSDDRHEISGFTSNALGGLSNIWGGQLLRYTQDDLDIQGDWPISIGQLTQYYDDLESHIGISGAVDQLHDFLGQSPFLLPAVPKVPAAQRLLDRFDQSRRRKLILGNPRVAVLTKPYRGYPAYQFGETEFFSLGAPGLYTAQRSLDELMGNGGVDYIKNYELVSYREDRDFVEVFLSNVQTRESIKLRCRQLLIACGTLQTARLILRNTREHERSLPFVDHPPTLLPLFMPAQFGMRLPHKSYPIQLIGTMRRASGFNMISFYYPGGMLGADLLADMPLPLHISKKLLPIILSGMLVAQIWEPSRPKIGNRLRLSGSGNIRIDYPERVPVDGLGVLASELRHLGCYTLKAFAKASPAGWGFHYAGCLPMRRNPSEFEVHVDGRLWNSQRVRIVDASVLPSLPAKNHSLTMMANAARIANEALKCEY